jgi:hypothetical protein
MCMEEVGGGRRKCVCVWGGGNDVLRSDWDKKPLKGNASAASTQSDDAHT